MSRIHSFQALGEFIRQTDVRIVMARRSWAQKSGGVAASGAGDSEESGHLNVSSNTFRTPCRKPPLFASRARKPAYSRELGVDLPVPVVRDTGRGSSKPSKYARDPLSPPGQVSAIPGRTAWWLAREPCGSLRARKSRPGRGAGRLRNWGCESEARYSKRPKTVGMRQECS